MCGSYCITIGNGDTDWFSCGSDICNRPPSITKWPVVPELLITRALGILMPCCAALPTIYGEAGLELMVLALVVL